QAFGARVTRQDVVDSDAIGRDFIRQRAREPCQSGAQTVRQHQVLNRLLHRNRSDVENSAPTSFLHARQHLTRQFNRAEERQSRRLLPLLASYLIEPPGGWSTGVRNENIDPSEALIR